MRVLLIGDIVGRTGRKAVKELLPCVKSHYNPELIIANGENAAGGFGLTKRVARELFGYGIDCLTMGNHTWDNKDLLNFIDEDKRIIRPLNYNLGVPGQGYTVLKKGNTNIVIVNLIGQVFMGEYNSPFMVWEEYFSIFKEKGDLIIVDFHAEATGEKKAFACFVDGKAAGVVGTHTHIQTADEMILPAGTGYITDLGMTGAVDSILGMDQKRVIEHFITKIPRRYKVAKGKKQLQGVIMEFSTKSGLCSNVERISMNS